MDRVTAMKSRGGASRSNFKLQILPRSQVEHGVLKKLVAVALRMTSPFKPVAGAAPTVKVATFPRIPSRSPKKKDKASGNSTSSRSKLKSTNLPTIAPGISYPSSTDHRIRGPDSGEELEVLKCILVREGYLQRLSHASTQGKISGSQLCETIDVLDLLRISTIEVVEAVEKWRKKCRRAQNDQSETSEFLWNSVNYLLKIASDLDFLEKHQGLAQWLGFTLIRNPFILPVNLDALSQLAHPNGSSTCTFANASHKGDSSARFLQVGGKRTSLAHSSETVTAWKAAQAAALADRKRAKHPYETRVLNDEELVPLGTSFKTTLGPTSTGLVGNSRPSLVLPSQIGDIEMTRIRVCEQILLQEEAVHGRYTHDIQGNLVPESEARRRLNMIELSGNAYTQCDFESSDNEMRKSSTHEACNEARPMQNVTLSPQSHPRKWAGMLGPISKPHRQKPSRRSPVDRSRGAHLEEALNRERAMNTELGVLIDHVREEIERKEMDLAYFESFPGVQLYGDELNEFRVRIRADLTRLRRDLAEKEYVYTSRLSNMNRKEEIIHVFKENRKNQVEHERRVLLEHSQMSKSVPPSVTTTNQETTNSEEHRIRPKGTCTENHGDHPLVHDMCATLIQKIARGKLARAAFEALKIEYYVGSKYIQAVVRGFLARRRVAKLYWQLTASIVVQRFARGLLARKLTARLRLARAMQLSALRIQRVMRGHFGRKRMKRIRRLFAARRELLQSSEELTQSDLKELADACYKTGVASMISNSFHLPSLVIGLVRIVIVFCSDFDDETTVRKCRWKEAAHFLRCSARLQRRMSKLAGVAATGDVFVRHSLLGAALLGVYSKDDQFSELTFSSLGSGWRAAALLYRWVKAFNTVAEEQSVLGSRSTGRPFLFGDSMDAVERMQEHVEDEENIIRELDMERRFVPRQLVHASCQRPRGIVLVVAFDVPLQARKHITRQLCQALPGIFVVVNRRLEEVAKLEESAPVRLSKSRKEQIDTLGADYTSIKDSLEVGHSVILDCDIGLTDANQRRFLGVFSALKASINPPPLCILLRGSIRNLQDQRIPHQLSSPTSSRTDLAESNSMLWRRMRDRDIKQAFEQSASWLDCLGQPSSTDEMIRLSCADPSSNIADASLVLVMEAVVILITPSKRYETPQQHTSGVSWKLARRLLANPTFFVRKLEAARHDSVTDNNLRVLSAYLAHPGWPRATQTHSGSGCVLHALSSWVVSVVTCAKIAVDRDGLAPPITRSLPVPGLFGNVVTYCNSSTDSGVVQAYEELLDAALTDVRVYRKVHSLDARRCLISVYHDYQRIYFSAYDSKTSWRWQRSIAEEDVDILLAPNSIERGEDTVLRRHPPVTQEEMYDRLARLCLLEAVSAPGIATSPQKPLPYLSESILNPKTRQLSIRPPAIRLSRRVIRLGGHRVTLTLAELSRGRIQVDIAAHAISLQLRRIVNIEEILERLSNREARNIFISPDQLPNLVLERLHLFRLRPTLPSVAFRAEQSLPTLKSMEKSAVLKLAIRQNESAPGRVLMRKSVRSRWLSRNGHSPELWLFTVFEHHRENRFSVEVYQPRSSQRYRRVISRREFQDMRLAELCQHPSSPAAPLLLRTIMKFLQFQTEPDDPEIQINACTLRHHILTRFPLAIRFVSSPHHEVDQGGVIRTYIQVETEDRIKDELFVEDVRLRISFPESCEEQELVWHDAEIDSCLSIVQVTWVMVQRADRAIIIHELARKFLRWDPFKSRIVAELPCGKIEARPSTRDVGRLEAPVVLASQSRSKKSMFSARSSRGILPAPSSCVILLDAEPTESNHVRQAPLREPPAMFVYDHDELILSGSYRTNGVLLTVQVFMRAVISRVVKSRVPVDRIEHEDSFEIAFDFYHPPTSSSQRCMIHGLAQLREVVGPDKAPLISSTTTRELFEHIVEARTSVEFETVIACDSEAKRIIVTFMRDRLFAKHKVTPLQHTLSSDATKNATKLIDARPHRGLKLLSLAKTLSSGDKVILTVFDVSHTKALQFMTGNDHGFRVELRVDCYVCETSERLTMSVDGADLVHLLDHASSENSRCLKATLLSQSADLKRIEEDKLTLARLIANHIGVERKRDGTPDRLFLTEVALAPSDDNGELVGDKERRLLGRAVQQVQGVHVSVCLFVVGFEVFRGLELCCYEPHSSATASLMMPPSVVATILGLKDGSVAFQGLFSSLDSPAAGALITHILTYVHLSGDKERGDSPKLSIMLDESDEGSDRMLWHHAQEMCEDRALVGSWQGFVISAGGADLCILRLGLRTQTHDLSDSETVNITSAELLCSAWSPRRCLAVTRVITSEQIATLLPLVKLSSDDLLRECAKRVNLRTNSLLAPPDISSPSIGTPRAPQINLTIEWSN